MKNLLLLILFIFFFVGSKSYSANMCYSSSSTSDTGTIYDSGGSGSSYTNYENCGFLIQPSTSPTSITLNFSQFSVDDGWDYLKVYDGTSSSGTLLGTFTGYSLPNSVTASSGSMYLRFTSDNVYTYSGFSATWTSTSGGSCVTFRDEFSTESYSRQDGTTNWSSNWNEVSDDDNASTGDIEISSNVLQFEAEGSGSTALGAPYIERQADLSSYTTATLSFDYSESGDWESDDDIEIYVSSNGGTNWNLIHTFTNDQGSSFQQFSQDISSYIASNTRIAFVEKADSSSERFYFDNVQIQACVTGSSSLPTPNLEYKFDACSFASSVVDSQGNYDGVASGTDSTDSTSVLGGRSLDLTGTSTSDWVTVPKAAITGLTDFSFSVWIKTGTSAYQQDIFQALGSSTGDDELEISLNYNNTVILTLRSNDETLSANTTLTDNAWHHLVITRENDDVCLYVDGSQTDCDSGASTGTLSVSYSNSVVIGQEQDSTRGSPGLNSGFDSSQSFKGYIDELKIYNSVLSSSQVQTLYTDESTGSNTSSCVADLIASYNFDDDWVTNDSLTDQTGSYDGNPSGSVSQVSAGASGSKGDTCYAGSFNGGEIDITGLPVSTSTGATTSVSFWMYWDGTNDVTVTGWNKYDLWLYNSLFGFNTWGSDITGISSSGLSSGWHHIAAVYTNGSVSNNKLYVDGILQSISHLRGSIYTSNAVVQSSLRIGGAFYGGYRFSGKLDNFKVYDGTITQAQVTTDMNESGACPSIDTPAIAFNCVENGTNGISGKLYTKTTAQSFSFDIVALRDSSTLETSFADGADHTVTVELVDNSSGGSCSAYAALSPAVSQSLLFTSSDAGNKASATMSSGTAYSSVACRVTDATDNPSIVGCSTDSFSIRPINFTLTSNLTNTGSTSTPIAKAGDNFTLTATATTGYTGTPSIDTSKLQAHSGAVRTGTLTGSFNTAVSGVATGSNFVYSEVGSIRFAAEGIYDSTFTSIDPSTECTDDFSNTVISKKVGCKFGNTATTSYFGRFTPDHFDVSLNTPVFAPACGTFTYLGQPFKYATNPVATFTAMNGSGITTQNYTGTDFWKINPASQLPSYTEATYVLTELDTSAPSVTDNGDGTGVLTYADTSSNILALTKAALSAPYDTEIALSFSLTDTDSITVANVNGSAQTNPVKFGAATSGNGISFSGANKTHRWGRVVMGNAHGSELSPLSIPLTTEYYNGTSFIQNTADSCTNFSLANDFSISDAADFNCSFTTQSSPVAIGSGSVKATMSNTTVNSGASELLISDNTSLSNGPGAGNTGYIEITSNLSNLSWLKYDWDTNGSHDNCPSTRATFGIYKGNNKQIYFREVY